VSNARTLGAARGRLRLKKVQGAGKRDRECRAWQAEEGGCV